MKRTMKDRVAVLGMLVVGLLLWELGVRLFEVPTYIVPSPVLVFHSLIEGLGSGLFLRHAAYTVGETLLGFFAAVVVGVTVGAAIALNRWAKQLLEPIVISLQSMPKVALAPLVVLWLGLGLASKVAISGLVAVFPIIVNTAVGLRSVDADRLLLFRALRADRRSTLMLLRVPSALAYILAGLEVAAAFALIGAIVGEFIGATHGLGMLLQSMTVSMDVSGQFAVLALLACIGLVMNRSLRWLKRRLLTWAPDSDGETAP